MGWISVPPASVAVPANNIPFGNAGGNGVTSSANFFYNSAGDVITFGSITGSQLAFTLQPAAPGVSTMRVL